MMCASSPRGTPAAARTSEASSLRFTVSSWLHSGKAQIPPDRAQRTFRAELLMDKSTPTYCEDLSSVGSPDLAQSHRPAVEVEASHGPCQVRGLGAYPEGDTG